MILYTLTSPLCWALFISITKSIFYERREWYQGTSNKIKKGCEYIILNISEHYNGLHLALLFWIILLIFGILYFSYVYQISKNPNILISGNYSIQQINYHEFITLGEYLHVLVILGITIIILNAQSWADLIFNKSLSAKRLDIDINNDTRKYSMQSKINSDKLFALNRSGDILVRCGYSGFCMIDPSGKYIKVDRSEVTAISSWHKVRGWEIVQINDNEDNEIMIVNILKRSKVIKLKKGKQLRLTFGDQISWKYCNKPITINMPE